MVMVDLPRNQRIADLLCGSGILGGSSDDDRELRVLCVRSLRCRWKLPGRVTLKQSGASRLLGVARPWLLGGMMKIARTVPLV